MTFQFRNTGVTAKRHGKHIDWGHWNFLRSPIRFCYHNCMAGRQFGPL